MRRSLATAILAAAAALALTGCPAGDAPEPVATESPAPSGLELTSPDFDDGAAIPAAFTCAETGRIPTLVWTGVPDGTESLALTVLDPDAPGGTFAHWVIYDLEPVLTGFTDGRYPADATQAVNSAGITGWFPPCPPPGDGPHRYVFTLYALDASLELADGMWEDVVAQLEQSDAPRATLTGIVDVD